MTTKRTASPEAPVEVVEASKTPTNIENFIEHQRKAAEEAGKALKALIPESVTTHSEAAIKESLEGYRNLVNSTIDEVVTFLQKAKLPAEEKKA